MLGNGYFLKSRLEIKKMTKRHTKYGRGETQRERDTQREPQIREVPEKRTAWQKG